MDYKSDFDILQVTSITKFAYKYKIPKFDSVGSVYCNEQHIQPIDVPNGTNNSIMVNDSCWPHVIVHYSYNVPFFMINKLEFLYTP